MASLKITQVEPPRLLRTKTAITMFKSFELEQINNSKTLQWRLRENFDKVLIINQNNSP